MSRRRRAVKREIYPDVQFGSRLVGRLVNTVMERGKRSVAQRIVYGAFDQIVENQEGTTALEVLERAVENAKPRLEVKSRRVGGGYLSGPHGSDRRTLRSSGTPLDRTICQIPQRHPDGERLGQGNYGSL